ncbi:MAG: glycoside hydrolase family 3 C-terminal domain-containing protein, partial [Muribaculaceae bacterium]|nr:glycoside hydrolase family 3 C-terminal domain-containing protein [Muribaculaceae bacterium]
GFSAVAQDTLTVATFNIWEGLEDDPVRRANFLQWVQTNDPDVLMIDELVGFTPEKLQKLGDDSGMPYTSLLKEEWYPVGVISKHPLETVKRIITPMEIVLGQKRGLWHGLLHVKTAGLDLLITHLSPFDYKFRRQEADIINNYADSLKLKDYLIAGDLNSISPYEAQETSKKTKWIKGLLKGDAKRPDWNNANALKMFDTSVMAAFFAADLHDPLVKYVPDPKDRMTHPTAFSKKLEPGSAALDSINKHIDYILLSPSLMKRCIDARVDRAEGISDHYPVIIKLKKKSYKDPSLSPKERVADLLPRMNVYEKMAQIRHLHSGDLFNGQEYNAANMKAIAGDVAYGFVEGFPLTGENIKRNMRKIQQHMVDSTRLGIPAFIVAESLHGSVHEGSTIFPQNIALASTFNPSLAYKRATAISEDLHYQGINQILSPCIDVVRDPRWGRVEETYGEDPFLNSEIAVNEVRGYLDSGISPMLKHFGPHGNPSGGLNLASVNGSTSEFFDIYMKPFSRVVTTLPVMAVMSTYNSWNNEPNSSSHYLLTDVLRGRWGFKGYVYADWGAVDMLRTFHKTAATKADAARQALEAGLDAEASSDCFTTIPQMIADSTLSMKTLDRAVGRVLLAKFKAGLFDDPYGNRYPSEAMHSPESVALSREIADESTVLLKNEGNLLPLNASRIKSIAVIGPNADQVQFGDYSWSRSNSNGVTPLEGIRNLVGDRVTVNYAKGCEIMTRDTSMIAEAVDAASRSDVAVIFCGSASASLARDYSGSNCGEGFDTPDLDLTGAQSQLIEAVVATGKPVVLVLVTGKTYAIGREKETLPAIVMQWYAGERAGESIADILFGNVNPSGHLPVSMAQSAGHLPAYYNHLPSDKGYYRAHGSYERPGRDYVFSSPDPLYAFGHGLSYTTFSIADLTTLVTADSVKVAFTVANTGDREGKAVPQVYVRDVVSSIETPVKQLKAFTKINLKPGESRRVNLAIPMEELKFTNNRGERLLEPGDFTIMAGFASDNLPLESTVTIGQSNKASSTGNQSDEPAYKGTGKKIGVSGVVRDVQSTPLKGVTVYSTKQKKEVGRTDAKGAYSVKVADDDTLVFRLSEYIDTTIPVKGRVSVHTTLAR